MKSDYQIRNERRIIYRSVLTAASIAFLIYCANNGNTTSAAFAGYLFAVSSLWLFDAVRGEIMRRMYSPND